MYIKKEIIHVIAALFIIPPKNLFADSEIYYITYKMETFLNIVFFRDFLRPGT